MPLESHRQHSSPEATEGYRSEVLERLRSSLYAAAIGLLSLIASVWGAGYYVGGKMDTIELTLQDHDSHFVRVDAKLDKVTDSQVVLSSQLAGVASSTEQMQRRFDTMDRRQQREGN